MFWGAVRRRSRNRFTSEAEKALGLYSLNIKFSVVEVSMIRDLASGSKRLDDAVSSRDSQAGQGSGNCGNCCYAYWRGVFCEAQSCSTDVHAWTPTLCYAPDALPTILWV